ncbi:MAG: hypothetical protein JXQ27_18075 [Acidobacteria bacterium]|nr:hypothetical protein [Acidobacteriota bacterium]
MRRFRFLLTAAVLVLCAMWTYATVEVQTTTPLVDCDGLWRVGQIRFIFSENEFQPPGGATCESTEFYVIVRLQLTGGVQVHSIGTTTNWALWVPATLVVEKDAGGVANFFNMADQAVSLYKWRPSFIDLLFVDSMYNWNLSTERRVRVTIGIEGGALPIDRINSNWWNNAWTQADTRLCFNFNNNGCAQGEFLGDFHHIGIVAYDLNNYITNPLCPDTFDDPDAIIFTTAYPVNFQPSNPAIAQRGELMQECEINAYWPTKGDDCNIVPCDHGPAYGDDCPADEFQAEACIDFPVWGDIWFNDGDCNWFAITEFCAPGSQVPYLFEVDGYLTVTLGDDYCLDPEFGMGAVPQAILVDPSGTWSYAYLPVSFLSDTTIQIDFNDTLDPDVPAMLSMLRDEPLCVLVDLDYVIYDACCVEDLPSDENLPIYVNIYYYPPDTFCNTGGVDPIMKFIVAYVWGCAPPSEPIDYFLTLWYPFLPPVNSPTVDWWGGIAITNYATAPTLGGLLYMYEEDGSEWVVEIPAMGGHELFLRQIAELESLATPMGSDLTFADRPMSAILYMFVQDPPYGIGEWEPGTLFNIDSFVLMGDGVQAYGYKARAEDGYWVSPVGPIWSKK